MINRGAGSMVHWLKSVLQTREHIMKFELFVKRQNVSSVHVNQSHGDITRYSDVIDMTSVTKKVIIVIIICK